MFPRGMMIWEGGGTKSTWGGIPCRKGREGRKGAESMGRQGAYMRFRPRDWKIKP